MGSVLAYAFYGVMAVALLYFVHKVLWFVKLRRLQADLVTQAAQKLERGTLGALQAWDQKADETWRRRPGEHGDKRPDDYVRRVEERLDRLGAELSDSRTVIHPAFMDALDAAGDRDAEPSSPERLRVVSIPGLEREARHVEIALSFPAITAVEPPDPSLYELQVRSRYGLVRRLAVMLLGAVDVVYSSRHVARMGLNQQVPIGVVVRRLSLVVVILLVVALDIAFGARRRLIELVETRFGDDLRVDWSGPIGDLANEYGPTVVALSAWLAAYGLLYVAMWFYLWRRSQLHLRKLRTMREQAAATIDSFHQRHRSELRGWASDYARTLDDAVSVSVRHAQMLVHRTKQRAQRRLASPALLKLADRVARALFSKLPEASTQLQDEVTTRKHSFAYYVWPRASEMAYQVELAQYRSAWRHVEMTASELRGVNPDPVVAHDLWRSLVSYATMFPDVVPQDTLDELEKAYKPMVARVVNETEADLAELERDLLGLATALEAKMAAAPSLVESRVQLCQEGIEADMARLSSEILRTREMARLEAMAFEI